MILPQFCFSFKRSLLLMNVCLRPMTFIPSDAYQVKRVMNLSFFKITFIQLAKKIENVGCLDDSIGIVSLTCFCSAMVLFI